MPKLNDLNEIYGLFKNNESHKFTDILNLLNLNEDNIKRGIMFLLKYGFLSIMESKGG